MRGKNFFLISPKQKKRIIRYGINRRWSCGTFEKHYRQPAWCSYTNALRGDFGCWSLVSTEMDNRHSAKEHCEGCDCAMKPDTTTKVFSIEQLVSFRNKRVCITMFSGAIYSGMLAGIHHRRERIILTEFAWHRQMPDGTVNWQHSKAGKSRRFNVEKIAKIELLTETKLWKDLNGLYEAN